MRCFLSIVAMAFFGTITSAAEPFQDRVIPFLKTYCYECHNAKKASAMLDLAKFTSTGKLLEDFRQWEHVVTFVKREEMPPVKAKQPTAKERSEMLVALTEVLMAEAKKQAGDPGVVLPRRLSNAEYDYSIQDLIGQPINPTSTFPIDPASGEGFNNTGEALTMSPSLFKKYYAAAQFVGDHAMLTTTGLKFAPYPVVTFADRQKYWEQAILKFYDSHKVDHSAYFAMLWQFYHRPASQRDQSCTQWAKARGLSERYTLELDNILALPHGEKQIYLNWVRDRFKALPKPANPDNAVATPQLTAEINKLVADIKRMSLMLTPKETPAIVANAGNGPIAHIERRAKTANERDKFDAGKFENPIVGIELRKTKEDTIQLTFTVTTQQTDGQGSVVIKPYISTASPDKFNAKDNKKSQPLRVVLGDAAKKLNFDGETLTLKVPSTVTIDLPATALNDKGNTYCYLEVTPGKDTKGVAWVELAQTKGEKNTIPVIPKDILASREFLPSAELFCKLFPNRFYYVDDTRGLSAGFHLIEGFFRDDRPLYNSILSDTEKKEIDQLWKEMDFVTGIHEKMLRGFVFFERSERNFLKHPDFDSIKEEDPYLTKDENLVRFKEIYLKRSNVNLTGDALAKHPISLFFDDFRNGLKSRAEGLKKAESVYLADLEKLAVKAYRRALTDKETESMRKFFREIAETPEYGIEHAVRATITRMLVSPAFNLRYAPLPAGDTTKSLPSNELASRLSYFLWSGLPDQELLDLAKSGKLHDEKVLKAQVARMMRDPRVTRFALEFFGQWLGYRDFEKQVSVDKMVYPKFDDPLKRAMFEEPTRLATHLITNDRSILDLLTGDTTFVNKRLAEHYGMQFPNTADEWTIVRDLHKQGRAGFLGMGVFLTKNSQPARTSPVKRGFWVVHKLLGEHIPAPPADVVALPAKETDTKGKTIRDLLKMHVEDVKCARCHQRFDFVGLSMEGFDAIGKARTKDLAGRNIDSAFETPDGRKTQGIPEFAKYLAEARRKEYIRTLCTKFLGYALGRSLQLSDELLLDQMQTNLEKNDYRFSALFETVILSPQFREQRCRDFSPVKFQEKPK